MRKIIGVVPLWDSKKESLWMLPGYMNGIMDSGGTPIVLPLTNDDEILKSLADMCNGFLFTGGHDVSPHLYKEEPLPQCGECCADRDNMEFKLLKLALEKNKPVLGICRGIQFINAALGGTLYQDLYTQKNSNILHHQKPPYHIPVHNVNIEKNTPLHQILQVDILQVNSYHHQAVKELSPQLLPMAYSEDGLIEAVYMPQKKFVWAVQWHPEFSYTVDSNSKKIFSAFVKTADNS